MALTKENGVIILGHPRSGTTLLRRLLNGHDNLHCPGETHVLNSCARFIQAEKTANGLDMGVLSGMYFSDIPEEYVLNNVRELGFSLLKNASAKKAGKRWVEKTAADSNYITEIDQLFGEHAYFIGIVRHGLDVAISSKDFSDAAGMYLDMFKPYINKYQQPLEALLRSWNDVTTNLLEFSQKHPENCVLIRYEDLIDEPEEVLNYILEFIGEDASLDIMTKGLENTTELGLSDPKCLQQSKVTKVNSKRWETLSDFQLNHLSEIANPLLELLGYDKIELKNSESKEDALRRYELELIVNARNKG
jgi:hypothetical protein